MAPIDSVTNALYPLLVGATEAAARFIASRVGARSPRTQRLIQFALFAFVACPLILAAFAALAWVAVLLLRSIASLL